MVFDQVKLSSTELEPNPTKFKLTPRTRGREVRTHGIPAVQTSTVIAELLLLLWRALQLSNPGSRDSAQILSTLAELCQIFADVGTSWPTLGKFRQNWRVMAKFGQIRTDVGQCLATMAVEFGQRLGNLDRKLAIGHCLSTSAQVRPMLAGIGEDLAHANSHAGRIWADSRLPELFHNCWTPHYSNENNSAITVPASTAGIPGVRNCLHVD